MVTEVPFADRETQLRLLSSRKTNVLKAATPCTSGKTFVDAMNFRFQFGGWKALLMLCGMLCLLASNAGAQTSSGQLSITMSVQSSISLVFQNNPAVGTPGFCPLTNRAQTTWAWTSARRNFQGVGAQLNVRQLHAPDVRSL